MLTAWDITNVKSSRGSDVRFYDDGRGPLWVYETADYLVGVVRAETWHAAYEACLDHIVDDARDFYDTGEIWDMSDPDEPELNEGFAYTGSDKIADVCLNGESLREWDPKHDRRRFTVVFNGSYDVDAPIAY